MAGERTATATNTDMVTAWMDDDSNFLAPNDATKAVYEVPPTAKPVEKGQQGEVVPETGTEAEPADDGGPTAREQIEREARGDAPETPADAGYTQDAQGKWHRPDGSFATTDEIAAIESVLAGDETAAAAAPAGAAAAKAEPPPATAEPAKAPTQPIGEVSVTVDGKAVSGLPNLTVTYKANGKTLENVPLDKLIRKAQLGQYSEEKEQAVLQQRQAAEQAIHESQQAKQALQQYEQWFQRILQDESYYHSARQLAAQQNSPEAQLAATQQELAAIRAQQQEEAIRAQATGFVTHQVTPRLQALAQQYQQDVTPEALTGKFVTLTSHLLVNGKVPLERLPEVVRIIEQDLTPWAEHLAQSRQTTETAATTAAKQHVEAAKVALALAKKAQARTMAPKGRAGALRETPPAPPPPKTADESVTQMFENIERTFGAR